MHLTELLERIDDYLLLAVTKHYRLHQIDFMVDSAASLLRSIRPLLAEPTEADIESVALAIRETRCAVICACTGVCHTNKAKAAISAWQRRG